MKRVLNLTIAFVALFILTAGAQTVPATKKNVNTKPYPYGNPVIRHMYTADAAPRVMPDGKVWMVTSVDHEDGGGYSTMHSYHAFSTTDMVNWTDHGEIFNIVDALQGKPEPENEDWALWAPDMIYRNGKYYLYYPVRILYRSGGYDEKTRKTRSYIAVAVSDAPDKRFKVLKPHIEGTGGIDPAVFMDDDGQAYLYYGSHMGAKLKENMYEIDGKPIKLDVGDEHFMEAIWMHKRNNKYYVSYHSHYGKPIDPENPDDPKRLKSVLDYGISDNPFGPFKHMGTMNYELGVNVNEGPKYKDKNYVPWRLYQSNHGGIVEYHGQEYLFYHTSALSSWRQDEFKGPGTWTQRSVCIDSLKYNADGTIIPVQQTLKSVDKVSINQAFEINLLKKPLQLNAKKLSLKFKNVKLGTGYYYFGIKACNVSKPTRAEIRLDKPNGKLVGTVLINKNGIWECSLREAKGKRNVYVIFDSAIDVESMRFFAGNPKK
jgi:arabinoxylan arabinofuranohydrolase